MNQEIKLYEKISDPMTAIVRMGEAIAQSGLFGVNSNGAGVVLAMEISFSMRPEITRLTGLASALVGLRQFVRSQLNP